MTAVPHFMTDEFGWISDDQPQDASHPKLLTRSEANALLPTIKPLIAHLQALHRAILVVDQQLEATAPQRSVGNGHALHDEAQQRHTLTQRRQSLIDDVVSSIRQLERHGAVLKDIEQGLVDFYALHEAQVVCLCWKDGEDRVRFWHTLEAGYPGRQPVDT